MDCARRATFPERGRTACGCPCRRWAKKKPFPIGFFILENTGRDDPVLFDCRDIPHGEPQIIELTWSSGRRQAFVVNLLTQWDIRDFKRPLAEYTGPGLKLDWLEIEGPGRPVSAAGHEQFFAACRSNPRSVAKAERRFSCADQHRQPADTRKLAERSARRLPADPSADADRLIRLFLPRAFRGQVAEELAKFYVARVQQKLDEKYSFYDAMLYGYKASSRRHTFWCSRSLDPSSTICHRQSAVVFPLVRSSDESFAAPPAENSRTRRSCRPRSNGCSPTDAPIASPRTSPANGSTYG